MTKPLGPLEPRGAVLGDEVYALLGEAILDGRLPAGERLRDQELAERLGVSRTPVREAMAQLEREGFVRSVPRRGIYVVRKSKQEVIEMITAWAALESMAARLITTNATTDEIASLRRMFATFENGQARAHLDEYSEVNIEEDAAAADLVMRVNNGNQTVPTLVFADGSALTNPSVAQVTERLAAQV